MRTVEFELRGKYPFLMHADNLEGCEQVKEWQTNPDNKNLSKPGDDRSPAWVWTTYCYFGRGPDGNKVLSVESAMISSALMAAGKKVPLNGKTTCKQISQSGIIPASEHYPFYVCTSDKDDGVLIPYSKFAAIRESNDFKAHCQFAEKHNFALWSKRARVGASKHVRVRARFEYWRVVGQVHVVADELTNALLEAIFRTAGRGGLGDWRPSAPKSPGPYGTFDATLKVKG